MRCRDEDFYALLRPGAIRAWFQPLVDLSTGDTIAFEALARGPADSRWHWPGAMIPYATRCGLLPILDWFFRAAAVRDASRYAVFGELPVFINVEPASAGCECPNELRDLIRDASDKLTIVAEITERTAGLTSDALADMADALRHAGMRIALDDIGVDSDAGSLLARTRPDIIKLDWTMIRRADDPEVRRTAEACRAYAESTGAVIVGEGIESEDDRTRALSLGAHIGQGYLFGRPSPIPRPYRRHAPIGSPASTDRPA
jgi:EAL domain-containing protein (putative c-di-GMP-specific phosphodiesterase class I)